MPNIPEDIKKSVDKKKEVISNIHLSPEIATYLDEWTRNPKSKIFVKLAEEYRKSGLLKKRLTYAKRGLRRIRVT